MDRPSDHTLSVSDTAHWIAAIRARESTRDDALFHDPFAAELAGPAGDTRPETLPEWPLVTRIKLIDDFVLQSVREGADCVLNLAAGLDTRPYRLSLPRELHWIEADLPGIIDYKARALQHSRPNCQLTSEPIDLTDSSARRAFLTSSLARVSRVLVITEGLLLYLEPAWVEALARDLASQAAIHYWVTDLLSPALVRVMKRDTDPRLAEDSRMRFGPSNGVGFFQPLGWTARDVRSIVREAAQLKRAPIWMRLLARLPEPKPDQLGEKRRWGAVVRFARTT
jgi:methyltransferase (TIGR00027 family)